MDVDTVLTNLAYWVVTSIINVKDSNNKYVCAFSLFMI